MVFEAFILLKRNYLFHFWVYAFLVSQFYFVGTLNLRSFYRDCFWLIIKSFIVFPLGFNLCFMLGLAWKPMNTLLRNKFLLPWDRLTCFLLDDLFYLMLMLGIGFKFIKCVLKSSSNLSVFPCMNPRFLFDTGYKLVSGVNISAVYVKI